MATTRVTRDSPFRRRDKRVEIPVLRLLIGDEVYETSNWSLGGLLLDQTERKYRMDDFLDIQALLPFPGRSYKITLDLLGRVVREDNGGKRIGVAFDSLNDRAFDVLQSLLTQRRLPKRYRKAEEKYGTIHMVSVPDSD